MLGWLEAAQIHSSHSFLAKLAAGLAVQAQHMQQVRQLQQGTSLQLSSLFLLRFQVMQQEQQLQHLQLLAVQTYCRLSAAP